MSRFFGMISHATLPDVTRLMELKNFQLLIKLFNLTILITIMFGAVFACFVNYYGEWAYMKWLSHKLPYDNMVMFILTFQAVVNCVWSLGGNMLMAINHHKQYAFSQVAANGLALFFCYFSANEYGLLGGVLAITICQGAIMVPLVYKYIKKFISKEMAMNYMISVFSAIFMLSILLIPSLLPFFWLAIFLLLLRILSVANIILSRA
jgi:O-antigen/teichoic acid export membrane protein